MLFVAGTGSFAADVAEVASDAGYEVTGFIELVDDKRVGGTVHGLPIVGLQPPPGAAMVVGAGGDRRSLCSKLVALGWKRQTVAHPRAHVPASARLEPGSFVGPGAIIGAAAVVGADALIARGALVGHHTSIGAAAVLNPGVNVAGNVTIEAGAFLGLGCVVRDHVTIGRDAVVAAGAVVVGDVGAGVQVRGVPARSVD
jgi:sugar O-acyltransferase (sialic acid O-acetyltransferase NeuD family)